MEIRKERFKMAELKKESILYKELSDLFDNSKREISLDVYRHLKNP